MKVAETEGKAVSWRGPKAGDLRFRALKFSGRKREAADLPMPARDDRFTVSLPTGLRVKSSDERESAAFSPEHIAFVDGVLRRSGLNPRHYRVAPLVRRLPACLRTLKVDSLPMALAEIDGSPDRLLQALNSLLIGTTSFFRDRQVFDDLDHHVIPALLRRGHHPRVWSAACSDGAELYSVAMMLDRHGATATYLGTDCRLSAVARAGEGIYPITATGEMPADFEERYFHLTESAATVSDAIRCRVEWEQADILAQPVSLRWDLILCRNLAIYLEPEPMASLWKKLAAAIVPGGYLVVGRAEKPRLPGFSCVAPCIYQKNSLLSIT